MIPVSHGKPCAGNPHARFDEGASASEEPRRNALLHKKQAGLFILSIIVSICANAAPVSPERAVDGVSAWVARGPTPTRLPTGAVRTFARDGIDYFHLVGLTGGGWVAMPAGLLWGQAP